MIERGTIRQRNWMWLEFNTSFLSLRTSTYWHSSLRSMQYVCHKHLVRLTCKQALRSARTAGREKEGELATTVRLWNLNSTSNSPGAPHRLSCQISANHREAETSAKGNDVISYVISCNHHFASTFSRQIFQLTFHFPPRRQDVKCTTRTKFESQEHSPIPTLAFCMWQLMCPSQNPRPCMLSNRQPRFRKSHIPLDCM